jgi:hypothetical protein
VIMARTMLLWSWKRAGAWVFPGWGSVLGGEFVALLVTWPCIPSCPVLTSPSYPVFQCGALLYVWVCACGWISGDWEVRHQTINIAEQRFGLWLGGF